jgi:hypothetical protein
MSDGSWASQVENPCELAPVGPHPQLPHPLSPAKCAPLLFIYNRMTHLPVIVILWWWQISCSPDAAGNAEWGRVPPGIYSALRCADGFAGNPTRECLPDGEWSEEISESCRPLPRAPSKITAIGASPTILIPF